MPRVGAFDTGLVPASLAFDTFDALVVEDLVATRSAISKTVGVPVEALGRASATLAEQFEAAKRIAGTGQVPLEAARRGISATVVPPEEMLATIRSLDVPDESLTLGFGTAFPHASATDANGRLWLSMRGNPGRVVRFNRPLTSLADRTQYDFATLAKYRNADNLIYVTSVNRVYVGTGSGATLSGDTAAVTEWDPDATPLAPVEKLVFTESAGERWYSPSLCSDGTHLYVLDQPNGVAPKVRKYLLSNFSLVAATAALPFSGIHACDYDAATDRIYFATRAQEVGYINASDLSYAYYANNMGMTDDARIVGNYFWTIVEVSSDATEGKLVRWEKDLSSFTLFTLLPGLPSGEGMWWDGADSLWLTWNDGTVGVFNTAAFSFRAFWPGVYCDEIALIGNAGFKATWENPTTVIRFPTSGIVPGRVVIDELKKVAAMLSEPAEAPQGVRGLGTEAVEATQIVGSLGTSYEDWFFGGGFAEDVGTGFGEMLAERFADAGLMDSVHLSLRKGGAPTDAVVVEIRTDSGGLPSSTVVSSGSIDASSLTTSFATYEVALSPVYLDGSDHWIVLRRTGALSSFDAYEAETSSTFIFPSHLYAFEVGSWFERTFRDLRWRANFGPRPAVEALARASATALGPAEASGGVRSTAVDPFESAKQLAATSVEPFEAPKGGISATVAEPFEANQKIAAMVGEALEALAGIRALTVPQIDSLLALSATAVGRAEALAGASSTVAAPFEASAAAGIVVATAVVALESLQGLAKTSAGASESTQPVSAAATVRAEVLAGVARVAVVALEAIAGVAARIDADAEARGVVSSVAGAFVEALQVVSRSWQSAQEALRGVQASTSGPAEPGAGLSSLAPSPVEAAARVASIRATGVESLFPLAMQAGFPFEEGLGVASTRAGWFEALLGVRALGESEIDAQGQVVIHALAAVAFEALRSLAVTSNASSDSLADVSATTLSFSEVLVTRARTLLAPAEGLLGLRASSTGPSEAPSSFSRTVEVSAETLLAIRATSQLPEELLRRVATTLVAPVESETRVAVAQQAVLRLEVLATVAATARSGIDAPAALRALAGTAADTALGVRSTSGAWIEVLLGVRGTATARIDARATVAALAGIPYETRQPIFNIVGLAEVPLDVQAVVASLAPTGVDALARIARVAATPAEALALRVVRAELGAEALLGVRQLVASPGELLELLRALAPGPTEAVHALVVLAGMPVEALAPGVTAVATLPVEALLGLRSLVTPIVDATRRAVVRGPLVSSMLRDLLASSWENPAQTAIVVIERATAETTNDDESTMVRNVLASELDP